MIKKKNRLLVCFSFMLKTLLLICYYVLGDLMLITEKGCSFFPCPTKKKNNLLGESVIGFPKDYTVVDLETTGLNPTTDLIIEFAAVRVRNGEVVDTFQSLCDPGFPIPPAIEAITGITSEMVRFSPNPRSVLPDFLGFVDDDFVTGHNVLFDVRFIAASNGDFKNRYKAGNIQ